MKKEKERLTAAARIKGVQKTKRFPKDYQTMT